MRELILASSSRYRAELLARLGVPFTIHSPDIDESRRQSEAPDALVRRLAREKARAVAAEHPGALVIGSDQVAVCDGHILGKPGSVEGAVTQLERLSGREVAFLTGLCLLDCVDASEQTVMVPTRVQFRPLAAREIERYVAREQPLDCAGAFKSEGLGIALFERLEGTDPNALIGLPLIELCRMLRQAGVDVLGGA